MLTAPTNQGKADQIRRELMDLYNPENYQTGQPAQREREDRARHWVGAFPQAGTTRKICLAGEMI